MAHSYICPHCREHVLSYEDMEPLDSGSRLTCSCCGEATIVTLQSSNALGAPIILEIGVRTPVEADHVSRALSVMASMSRLLSPHAGSNEILAMAATQLQMQVAELIARDGEIGPTGLDIALQEQHAH